MGKEMYPLHDAVMTCQPGNRNDVEPLIDLLDKIGEKALDQPIKEWYDCTPLRLAANVGYAYECTLALLKRGADPYIKDSNGEYAVLKGMRNESSALGHSEGFWERFNKICVEKSPPKQVSRKEKLLEIVKSF